MAGRRDIEVGGAEQAVTGLVAHLSLLLEVMRATWSACIWALNYTRGNRPHESFSCAAAENLLISFGQQRSCHAALATRPVRHAARCLYLNAAAWSPLPLASQEAGRAAMGRKGQPWKLPDGFPREQYERTRKAAAALIGAEPDDVALISSVGYGVSTAGKVLPIPRGTRVIVLENDHTSPVLEWHAAGRPAASWSIR